MVMSRCHPESFDQLIGVTNRLRQNLRTFGRFGAFTIDFHVGGGDDGNAVELAHHVSRGSERSVSRSSNAMLLNASGDWSGGTTGPFSTTLPVRGFRPTYQVLYSLELLVLSLPPTPSLIAKWRLGTREACTAPDLINSPATNTRSVRPAPSVDHSPPVHLVVETRIP